MDLAVPEVADSQMIEYFLKFPIETIPVFVTIFPLIAILYRNVQNKPSFRYLFLYLWVKLIFDILMICMASKGVNNLYLYNIWVLTGFFLLSGMMTQLIESEKAKIFIEATFIIFFFLFFVDWIEVGWYRTGRIATTLESFLMIAYLSIYFVEVSRSKISVNLFRCSPFWTCSALMIYFCSCSFISVIYYFYDQVSDDQTFVVLNMIPYILESAYLCVISFGILASE